MNHNIHLSQRVIKEFKKRGFNITYYKTDTRNSVDDMDMFVPVKQFFDTFMRIQGMIKYKLYSDN